MAVLLNKTEMVKILIGYSKNVNIVDEDGKTPLDLAKTEEIRTLLLKAAENTVDGSVDESSTDSEEVLTTGSAQPIAPTEPAQTEEQPSSFFGSLFSILMKPFSLIASFFGGFFSWLFGSDEPIQSSSESDQPVVLESSNNSGDHDII